MQSSQQLPVNWNIPNADSLQNNYSLSYVKN